MNVSVSAESSTGLFISWQPPEVLKQNGIITSYNVEIRPVVATSQILTYNLTANTSWLSVTGGYLFMLYYQVDSNTSSITQVWTYIVTTRWLWPPVLPLAMVHSQIPSQ